MLDLSTLSVEELKKEIERREAKKDELRETYKELVKEATANVIFKLCAVSEMLSNAKTDTFKYFEDVLKLKAEIYGVKEGQQTHTFSFDRGEVTIGYRINDGWDDTVNTGIAKVKAYISSLAKNKETEALVNMIFSLLKQDAKGNLKGSRVLELQKLAKDVDDQEFKDGVHIISEAYRPVRSVWFIEASLIADDGTKTPIPLNISSVDFSQGYQFEYYGHQDQTD